jgi:hypothetical protein
MVNLIESIGIRPIHIRISTNTNPNDTIFTRDMIHIPEKQSEREEDITNTISNKQSEENPDNSALSNYPYFTDTVRFPTATILKLSRQDQIKLLFDKKMFKQKIGHKSNIDQEERSNIAEYNHNAILNILMPTSFPRKNNIHETFSENIKNMPSASNMDDDVGIFNLLFSGEENKYGYLNLNGQTNTVAKIVLLNDIINDKSFGNFIKSGNNFQLWRKTKIVNLNREKEKISENIKSFIESHLDNMKEKINDKTGNVHAVFQEISNRKTPQNRMSNVPLFLMEPYFNVILNHKKEDNINDIISAFSELYKLKKQSGERESTYIPVPISNLPGFKQMLNNSYDMNVKNEMIKSLTEVNNLYKYITLGKDINDEDLIQQSAIKELLNYSELKSFINEINKYAGRNRQYSNKALNDLFNQIETDMEEFVKFIEFVNEIRIEGSKPKEELLSNSIMTDRLKTGVMSIITSSNTEKDDSIGLSDQANYDTSIHLGIIPDIVNDDNIDDVKCPYRNQMLNSMYSNLKYSEDKNPVLYYIEQPFDMGQTKKGGKLSNKKRTCKKRRCKKIGGYPGQALSSKSLSIKSLKKRKKNKKTNSKYTSPYRTI